MYIPDIALLYLSDNEGTLTLLILGVSKNHLKAIQFNESGIHYVTIYLILIFYTYLPIIHHSLNRQMKGWDTFAKRNSNGTEKNDCFHY